MILHFTYIETMIAKTLSGLFAYLRALSFISKPGFGKYFIYSGLIGLLLFGFAIYIVTLVAPLISGLAGSLIPWNIGWISSVTGWISYLFSGAAFIFIFKYLMLIMTSPLMSALSEKVEKEITGTNQSRGVVVHIIPDLIRSLRINLRNIIREMFFLLILFALSFLPIIGIITTVLGIIIQGFYAGWGNVDFWAERHLSYNETVRYMKQNKGMLIGNGIVYIFLISIPVVGVFFGPPLATIAVTTEAIKDYDQEYV